MSKFLFRTSEVKARYAGVAARLRKHRGGTVVLDAASLGRLRHELNEYGLFLRAASTAKKLGPLIEFFRVSYAEHRQKKYNERAAQAGAIKATASQFQKSVAQVRKIVKEF